VLLPPAVDDPVRVEDLVPAVLRVRLREHHELDVGWIAVEPLEALDEVVDLVGRQGEAKLDVRAQQGVAAAAEHVDGGVRARLRLLEQARGVGEVPEHDLRHAVVQQRGRELELVVGRPVRVAPVEVVGRAALDAPDVSSPQLCAISVALEDQARSCPDAARPAAGRPGLRRVRRRPVMQQPIQHLSGHAVQGLLDFDEVDELRGQATAADRLGQPGLLALQTEGGQGGGAAQCEHGEGLRQPWRSGNDTAGRWSLEQEPAANALLAQNREARPQVWRYGQQGLCGELRVVVLLAQVSRDQVRQTTVVQAPEQPGRLWRC